MQGRLSAADPGAATPRMFCAGEQGHRDAFLAVVRLAAPRITDAPIGHLFDESGGLLAGIRCKNGEVPVVGEHRPLSIGSVSWNGILVATVLR